MPLWHELSVICYAATVTLIYCSPADKTSWSLVNKKCTFNTNFFTATGYNQSTHFYYLLGKQVFYKTIILCVCVCVCVCLCLLQNLVSTVCHWRHLNTSTADMWSSEVAATKKPVNKESSHETWYEIKKSNCSEHNFLKKCRTNGDCMKLICGCRCEWSN
jgi:hypothetical protein